MADLAALKRNFLQSLDSELHSEYEARFFKLLGDKYQYSRLDYLSQKDWPDSDLAALQKDLEELKKGYPVQYLIGWTEFAGMQIGVSPAVLIPRPETEELITLALQRKPDAQNAIDLGTGSGCIALALAQKIERVYALDKSPEALEQACTNAKSLSLSINFMEGDLLGDSASWPQNLDLIISNPPYVRELEKAEMEAGVYEKEPEMALFVPDDDALRFYRAIVKYAVKALKPQGLLALEINQYLGEEMRALLEENFEKVDILQDQFGKDRFALAQ
ncbi:peptide chain release factor N(5)-glutamine methyltransferase [Croceimicrobium sp.]|uniref:peptide chain release factor N(5)-glutamine methyltransferase n=1 Tax=Croceimicrobium sp. TaxID=2828340 RepID=UPI003BA9D0E6